MSQIRKILGADGSLQGYWDDEAHCWVSEPQAADADDTNEPVDYSKFTKDELKEMLRNANIAFDSKASKDDLLDLIAKVNEENA